MNWNLKIAPKAEKLLRWLPEKDRKLISHAFDAMMVDPFSGDIVRLHNERSTWRRRVGNYRIFFDVYPNLIVVEIVEIEHRSSKTY